MNELSQKELNRAGKALLAAKTLLENQLYEDCVSRAYYAVLHAAKAALVTTGVEPACPERRRTGIAQCGAKVIRPTSC